LIEYWGDKLKRLGGNQMKDDSVQIQVQSGTPDRGLSQRPVLRDRGQKLIIKDAPVDLVGEASSRVTAELQNVAIQTKETLIDADRTYAAIAQYREDSLAQIRRGFYEGQVEASKSFAEQLAEQSERDRKETKQALDAIMGDLDTWNS
jgi:hypothetical protein